jgi:anti-sigma factor RsiW
MSEARFSPGCERSEPELNAYVDGELPPAERAALERHLAGCARCQTELELLRLVSGSLGQLPRPEPSEAMRRRLLTQVAAERPLRRVEIVSTERHGDRVFERHEVRWTREPVLLTPPERLTGPPAVSASRQFRWATADHSNRCIIESHYGGDHHE